MYAGPRMNADDAATTRIRPDCKQSSSSGFQKRSFVLPLERFPPIRGGCRSSAFFRVHSQPPLSGPLAIVTLAVIFASMERGGRQAAPPRPTPDSRSFHSPLLTSHFSLLTPP